MTNFILGSSSSSRLKILETIGFKPDLIISPNVDETVLKKELPHILSRRLAVQKMLIIANQHIDNVILTADTVVAKGRRILDKTTTKDDMINHLTILSDGNHSVFTTICIAQINTKLLADNLDFSNPTRLSRSLRLLKEDNPQNKICIYTNQTRIKMKSLTLHEIEKYASSLEGINRAGGYDIFGLAQRFIIQITGCPWSVGGLPSYKTAQILSSFGVKSHI